MASVLYPVPCSTVEALTPQLPSDVSGHAPRRRQHGDGWREFKQSIAGIHSRLINMVEAADAARAAPPPHGDTAPSQPHPPHGPPAGSSSRGTSSQRPSLPPRASHASCRSSKPSLMSSEAMRRACPTPETTDGFPAPVPLAPEALRTEGQAAHTGDPLKLYRIRKNAKCLQRERAMRWFYEFQCRQGALKQKRVVKPRGKVSPVEHELGRSALGNTAFDQYPYSAIPAPVRPNTARLVKTFRRQRREVTPKITADALPGRHYLTKRRDRDVALFRDNAADVEVERNACAAEALDCILRRHREGLGAAGVAAQ